MNCATGTFFFKRGVGMWASSDLNVEIKDKFKILNFYCTLNYG